MYFPFAPKLMLAALAVAGLSQAGSLDPGFGTGGTVITQLGPASHALALAVGPDGKITAAGVTDSSDAGAGGRQIFALARYLPDGRPDRGFAGTGALTTRLGTAGSGAHAILALPDGKTLAGGYGSNEAGVVGFALVRYTRGGQPDPGFGAVGSVFTALGPQSQIYALARQPDGKVVAAGYSGYIATQLALVRYLPDGQIVLAGSAKAGDVWGFALARYRP